MKRLGLFALAASVLLGGAAEAQVTDALGATSVRNSEDATYSAGTTAKTAGFAGTTPFFSICGNATTTVRVLRFNASYTVATAAVYGDVVLKKTSTATSGGTSTTLTAVPNDSFSVAAGATNVKIYTAAPTAGAGVGVVYAFPQLNAAVTGTVGTTVINAGDATWQARTDSEAVVLRGTAQCLEGSFGTTTTNAPTLTISVTWTER